VFAVCIAVNAATSIPAPASSTNVHAICEEGPVDDTGLDLLRLPAEADECETDGGEIAERGDRRGARLEIVDLGNREGHVLDTEAVGGLTDVDQPIRISIDERTQQHAAKHAEDCRVCTDAQGERDDDRQR
jgi:hypothetical protein